MKEQKYMPTDCKSCRETTFANRLGGLYCLMLKKSVMSPRETFIDKDCPYLNDNEREPVHTSV